MKKLFIFLFGLVVIASCTKPSSHSENTASLDSLASDTVSTESEGPEGSENPYLYGQTDSVFTVNGKSFKVTVKQYDLTEVAASQGDTIVGRPTYTCKVLIIDAAEEIVFADSVLRDSWAYPGKIVSIDHYQMALPQLSNEGNEIILAFNVYEEYDGDAIIGSIAFDVNKLKARYFWAESTLGD